MGVNRFIDYANPMYWAKMLRKGGIPKRKPYSFTVKINDYVIGEGAHINTVKCTFGNEDVLEKAGESHISEIYDKSKVSPQLLFEVTPSYSGGGEGSPWEGYSVSPSSKWRLKLKTGEIYEGTIGVGTTSMGGLFALLVE